MLIKGRLVGFIPTADAERARAFYEGTLGMRFVQDDGFAMVLDAGGTMMRLVRVGEFTPARFTIAGWAVRGIEAMAKRLAEAGVPLLQFGFPGQAEGGVWTAPDGDKVAWFADPDGNVLSISEHVAGA